MTNEAITFILDYFHGEAMMATGATSADQLVRSIDDVRYLLSHAPAVPGTTEEFDIMPCLREMIDILNLASEEGWEERMQRVVLDSPPASLLVTQNRKALEQMLMRVLDGALKLMEASEASLSVKIEGSENWLKLVLSVDGTDHAMRVANWLNADPERVRLQDPEDVPLGISLMVAGKRLRAVGGAASLEGNLAVSLGMPSHTAGARRPGSKQQARANALNVLVAEDNDESFTLTEMALEGENIWRARDGQDALEIIQHQRFDVIFMDVHMPGMTGYEVIRSMRDWETRMGSVRTPMVVLSSDDVETQQRSAAEFGCSGFLRKPLGCEVLPLLARLK